MRPSSISTPPTTRVGLSVTSSRVLTKSGPATLRLVGTATYGDLEGMPGVTLVATDDVTAQQLFAEPGRYDDVLVSAATGVTASELGDRITAATAGNGDLEVVTGEQDTADQQADFASDLSFFNTFLMAFAYVSLFVGTFIIYNTFSIVVAQRMKDLAMLRAIGARRSQVLRSIVLEAILVGVVASGIGLAAGIGLSFGLRSLLASVGLEIPSGPIVVAASTVITAFVGRRHRERAVRGHARGAGQPGQADRRPAATSPSTARASRSPVRSPAWASPASASRPSPPASWEVDPPPCHCSASVPS